MVTFSWIFVVSFSFLMQLTGKEWRQILEVGSV